MASRMYTAAFEGQTWAAADTDIDIWELTPADDNPIEIVGLFIEPYSETGDTAEEIIRFHVVRGHTTSGSTPDISPTPVPTVTGTQAASFTTEAINSTIASAGTGVTIHAGAFNVRTGLQLWLPESCEWGATQADTTIVVRSSSTVADDLNFNSTIYVREYGP
jgi:hypothetical protein